MKLAVGQTLASAVDDTKVVVIRAPEGSVTVTCGGVPMQDPDATRSPRPADPAMSDGCQLGKRYVDADDSLELLCTRGGTGTLAIEGRALTVKQARPLPASD